MSRQAAFPGVLLWAVPIAVSELCKSCFPLHRMLTPPTLPSKFLPIFRSQFEYSFLDLPDQVTSPNYILFQVPVTAAVLLLSLCDENFSLLVDSLRALECQWGLGSCLSLLSIIIQCLRKCPAFTYLLLSKYFLNKRMIQDVKKKKTHSLSNTGPSLIQYAISMDLELSFSQ